jgi:hypothetical protein
LGTDQIAVLDEIQLLMMELQIDQLSDGGYISDDSKQLYIKWLEDPNTKLYEGGGRHPALVTLGTSYLYRYANGWKDLTDDERKAKLWEWNKSHCIPPKPEKEFNNIWKWIIEHHRKNKDEQREKRLEEERRMIPYAAIDDPINMPGCISYQISTIPDKYILGTP